MRQRARHVDAAEHAGLENAVGVRETGAHPHGAGRVVDAVLGEVELALEYRFGAVGDANHDVEAAGPFLHAAAAQLRVAGIAEIQALIDVEVEVDRV